MWLNYFLNLKWLEEKSGYHPSLSSKWSAAIYINGCTSHILQFTWHKQPSHPLLKSICIDICSQRETERWEELAICHTVGKTKAFSTVFSQLDGESWKLGFFHLHILYGELINVKSLWIIWNASTHFPPIWAKLCLYKNLSTNLHAILWLSMSAFSSIFFSPTEARNSWRNRAIYL